MAKSICEYCGAYIKDTEERCPNCGAVNANHKRFVSETPRTIEQLKSWYKARNLPPENVTRFFIGKDIKAPRAFGIYEDNGVFIVYKNKSNGERAIRYQGTDEEYAVNEIYLKLKEEILNQKNLDAKKRNISSRNHSSSRRRKSNRLVSTLLIYVMTIFTIFSISGFVILYEVFNEANSFSSYDYYLTDVGEVYYFEGYDNGGYSWWKFDTLSEEWEYYNKYKNEKEGPDGVLPSNKYYFASDLAEELNIDYEKLNIYNSKAYIDAGNHSTPLTSYYYYDNNLYYFLDDSHSYYGDSDNTGWYIYNNDSWEYYCDEDDKDLLGEGLWYYDDNYYVGNDITDIYYYNDDDLSTSWAPSDFEDTSWYKSYEENESAYDDYMDDYSSSYDDNDYDWSSDSDWDWDSGSSWDSGGSDWDSDW